MSLPFDVLAADRTAHPWLRAMRVAILPGPVTPVLQQALEDLPKHFERLGHHVVDKPDDETDVILTTATFGEPLSWRHAVMLTARRRFGLTRTPTVYTMLHARPAELNALLQRFETILAKEPPVPDDFDFPGLAPSAWRVLVEQGRRGGPILSLLRLLQSQSMCIRLILIVGDDEPLEAYTFDLVGAHPRTDASDRAAFYQDLITRMATAVSTEEVTEHQVLDEPVPRALWQGLASPAAMRRAGRELGKRHFFTQMIRIADLVSVPAVGDAVASQYSEGCFATYDAALGGLVATVTGSARPINKDSITEDDLAVIVGVRDDGKGALVRHVEGKRNIAPSSEAVEMKSMDQVLPEIVLPAGWGIEAPVPVVRSKLHGHRGISAYDPQHVEYAPLDPPYYHYPVSCATEAQAEGIRRAFGRSQALLNPDDPRTLVFTVLPGHGVVIAEKWVAGKEPLQIIWEAMDAGYLKVNNLIPQGPMSFIPDEDGMMRLYAPE